MERRRAAWLLSLALMAVGGVVAHALAYRLVVPASPAHAATGSPHAHAYASHWRFCITICLVIVAVGMGLSAARALRRGRRSRTPLWLFALVPPAGFVAHEQVEELLQATNHGTLAGFDPILVVGILLQVPFAVAAVVGARALLRLAAALVHDSGSPPRIVAASEPFLARATVIAAPRASVLARGYGERAPPFLVPSR